AIADTSPAYVKDVLAVASGGHARGDIGALQIVLLLEAGLYLGGGLVFGIGLYRANLLARWAAVLLAVGGVVSAGLQELSDPWFRLLAFPNGIAMIGLGYSLWRATAASAAPQPAADPTSAPTQQHSTASGESATAAGDSASKAPSR